MHVQNQLIKCVISMCSFFKRYTLPISGTRIFLIQLALTLLVCITHAEFADANTCDDPEYPDQYPSLSRECDNVVQLVVDKENSVKVLENNDHGTVIITGGSGTYTWSISGQGFFLDANLSQTTLEKTTAQTVTIYSNGEACGTGYINVNDGCSSNVIRVASKNGKWGPSISGIGQEGLIGEYTGQHAGGSYIFMGESKAIRQFERRLSRQACGSSGGCSYICYDHCASPDNCTLGCDAFGCCTRFESVFSNLEYHVSAPHCIDFMGRDGLLAASSGYNSSCSCSCTTSNWHQEWICQ